MAVRETARLILRPLRKNDIDRLADLMADADFMRFSPRPYTREQTQTVLEKFLAWNRARRPSPCALVVEADSLLIGYCGFLHWHLDGADEIEIGYRLDPGYWNQGIATEAATAVRNHAFADVKLKRVISLIHPNNIPLRRVAEKIGMHRERETIFKGFPTDVFAINR